MKISDKGKQIIKNFEGLRLQAYKPMPSELYWTIGYGHYGPDVKVGMRITQEQANNLLDKDLEKFEEGVTSCVKVPLNENQFSALVSFAFNVGLGALQTSTLLKKLNAKDYSGASNEFLRWDKCNGKSLAGLTKRRQAERALFLECSQKEHSELPYAVRTLTDLNVRANASTSAKIWYVAKKGTILKVWAIKTAENKIWGKNGNEYFCLEYTERI